MWDIRKRTPPLLTAKFKTNPWRQQISRRGGDTGLAASHVFYALHSNRPIFMPQALSVLGRQASADKAPALWLAHTAARIN
jgi:hypothetical protein